MADARIDDWRTRPRCDQTAVWGRLQAHFDAAFCGPGAFDLRHAFEHDAERCARFGLEAPGVFADLSKNLLDAPAHALLVQLAHACGLPAHRDAMLEGAPINISEHRPATHVWARNPDLVGVKALSSATFFEAKHYADAHQAVLACAARVRADAGITDVVNLGIGGSDLGPRMAVQALRASGQADGPQVHFVANMDGHELAELLPRLTAQRTLFIVASKTFGTAETMQNAASARAWLQAQGVSATELARHFVTVSANRAAAQAFGAGCHLSLDEGVGGRFSLWSGIGLSIAIQGGPAAFNALLAGAHAMDQHFAQAPLERNLPVQLALLDLWYRNFHRFGSRCVVPYHHGLRSLPAYLQQLEMESNGKRVDFRGQPLACASAPATWGGVGSNAQHAFFQLLHQGTDVVPVEFVLVRQPTHALAGHHEQLLGQALAQARALMLGQAGDAPERTFPGNRPSTVLLLPDLSLHSLGSLLALYEHRTFALGSLWGINSFDQWGVELGKRQARAVLSAYHADTPEQDALDPSTHNLLARLRHAAPKS